MTTNESSGIPVSLLQSQAPADHIRQALALLGFDMEDENFKDTPQRFIKYLQEYLGDEREATRVLETGFTSTTSGDYRGLIVQSNIPFRTICPHHLLPVVGHAHLGYIPNGRVVGLSKLTRVVAAVGREKPRMQEDITDILVDTLQCTLDAKGAITVISAEHMCMCGRGVTVSGVPTITSSVRGLLRDVPAARQEFFQMIALSSGK